MAGPCIPRPRELPTIGLAVSIEVRAGVATDFGARASCVFGCNKAPREAELICVVCFSCPRFSNLDRRDETALIGVASVASALLSAIVNISQSCYREIGRIDLQDSHIVAYQTAQAIEISSRYHFLNRSLSSPCRNVVRDSSGWVIVCPVDARSSNIYGTRD